MSPNVSICVLFDSKGLVVLEYSQDLIAKKKAPIINCDAAIDSGSPDNEYNLCIWRITEIGIAFCRFSLLSWALNPASIRLMLNAFFPSIESRGSGA